MPFDRWRAALHPLPTVNRSSGREEAGDLLRRPASLQLRQHEPAQAGVGGELDRLGPATVQHDTGHRGVRRRLVSIVPRRAC
jgi:hypothetical protein